MNWFTLLANAGTIIGAIEALEGVISRVIQGDTHIPSLSDINLVIDQVRILLKSGLINIAGVDDAKIDAALQDLEAKISQVLGQASKNVVIFGDVHPITPPVQQVANAVVSQLQGAAATTKIGS